jgi:hypothetical protein
LRCSKLAWDSNVAPRRRRRHSTPPGRRGADAVPELDRSDRRGDGQSPEHGQLDGVGVDADHPRAQQADEQIGAQLAPGQVTARVANPP